LDGEARLLHFGGVVQCDRKQKITKYAWLAAALDENQLFLLQRWAEKIAMDQPEIPYRFAYAETSGYDDLYRLFLPGPGSDGLTCATFVLWVFLQAGVRPLETTGWRSTFSDRRNIRAAVARFRETDPVLADAFERDITTPRYRPSDVAAAGLFDAEKWPIPFRVARRAGKWIVELIHRHYDAQE
jgi:hypothetical protein